MTLGQRIQELRKGIGLSQEGLGEALGVSRQAVSKWEADGGIPELDTLIAMSRLFGISIGELLGVESPEQPPVEERTGGITEEQMEAILRRYAEQTQPQPQPRGRGWTAVLLAVVTVLTAVLLVWISNIDNTVSNIRQELSNLESSNHSLHNLYNGLLDDVRQQISTALREQDNLVSTFEHQVVGFDWEAQTVDVAFSATLKEYNAGETLQFVLEWLESDDTPGRLVCDPVEGPDFQTVVTIPMNYHLEVSLRATSAEGTVREQFGDIIYAGMQAGDFELLAYNLTSPFLITYYSGRLTVTTVEGESGSSIDILSLQPQWVWPVSAHLTAAMSGETVADYELELGQLTPGSYEFYGRCPYTELIMREGDTLIVTVMLTDNLGREYEFAAQVICKDGDLYSEEMAVPVIPD